MADKNKAPKHRGTSAKRYWQSHVAEIQKGIRVRRHKRRMERKAAKQVRRAENRTH